MTLTKIRTLGDLLVLSLTIWAEARGERIEGKVAVGCVVRNRLKHPTRFGVSFVDVCLAPAQFSCWSDAGGALNNAALVALADALEDGQAPISDPVFRECRFVASGIIGGELRDNTSGSSHYVTQQLYNSPAAPRWVKQAPVLARIGSQVYMSA